MRYIQHSFLIITKLNKIRCFFNRIGRCVQSLIFKIVLSLPLDAHLQITSLAAEYQHKYMNCSKKITSRYFFFDSLLHTLCQYRNIKFEDAWTNYERLDLHDFYLIMYVSYKRAVCNSFIQTFIKADDVSCDNLQLFPPNN